MNKDTIVTQLLAQANFQKWIEQLRNPNTGGDAIVGILTEIARFMIQSILGVALIFLILSSIQLITAGGNQAQSANAKKSILFIVIGIAIGVGALAGLNLIRQAFIN